MDWSTYKQQCDRPDYWSRWMLEQCVDLLAQLREDALADALGHVMESEAMATPEDHHGGAATEMYHVVLPAQQRQALLVAMRKANAHNLRTPLTKSRGLAGFVEVCQEFAGCGD